MASSNGGSLYLGFDLSTQQLKGLAVSSDLKVEYEAKFDFDADSRGFNIKKGVMTNEAEHEVFAPVALWLQALDSVLQRLRDQGLDFRRVRGISGAGQQHGSVYWSKDAEKLLANLDKNKTLEEQLPSAFSHPFSPNWQDASTQKECEEFDAYLGGAEVLAKVTGSKAHHVGNMPSSEMVMLANPMRRGLPALRFFASKENIPSSTKILPVSPLSRPSWHRSFSAPSRRLTSRTCAA